MSQDNVQLVRHMLERFAIGELTAEALDERIEIRDHDILDADEYRGLEGVSRWIEDWSSGLPVYSFEVQEVIDVDETVVVAVILLKARGRGSCVDVERQDAIVYTLDAGKITRLDYYNSKSQALASVGLAEGN